MKFNLFSNAHGYYKDVYADLQNKSVIKDVLGDDASKVTDAYVVDGVQLKVEGDKLLKLEGKWVYFGTEDAIKLFFDKD